MACLENILCKANGKVICCLECSDYVNGDCKDGVVCPDVRNGGCISKKKELHNYQDPKFLQQYIGEYVSVVRYEPLSKKATEIVGKCEACNDSIFAIVQPGIDNDCHYGIYINRIRSVQLLHKPEDPTPKLTPDEFYKAILFDEGEVENE